MIMTVPAPSVLFISAGYLQRVADTKIQRPGGLKVKAMPPSLQTLQRRERRVLFQTLPQRLKECKHFHVSTSTQRPCAGPGQLSICTLSSSPWGTQPGHGPCGRPGTPSR